MIKKFLFLVLFFTNILIGLEIKKINEVNISQDKKILQMPFSFCVTEDQTFIVVDIKAANIKIYENNGKLLKILGKKGLGPREFISPMICDFSKPYFAVTDYQRKKIFIYKQNAKTGFDQIKSIYCLGYGSDIKIIKNKILISAYKTDKKGAPYSLYMHNLMDNKTHFLITEAKKYGFSSLKEDKKYLRNLKTYAIGTMGYCDYLLNDVYYVWEGNLKIFKISSESGEITTFGKKTKNYIQLVSSKTMVNCYKKKNFKQLIREMQKISYINGLFANKDFVGLLYGNYYKNLSAWKIFLQLYTPNGKFLKEITLPEVLVQTPSKPGRDFYYNKKKNLLYYMYHKLDKDLDDIYTVATYKIIK